MPWAFSAFGFCQPCWQQPKSVRVIAAFLVKHPAVASDRRDLKLKTIGKESQHSNSDMRRLLFLGQVFNQTASRALSRGRDTPPRRRTGNLLTHRWSCNTTVSYRLCVCSIDVLTDMLKFHVHRDSALRLRARLEPRCCEVVPSSTNAWRRGARGWIARWRSHSEPRRHIDRRWRPF